MNAALGQALGLLQPDWLGDDAVGGHVPCFDAHPAFAGEVERLGEGLFPEGAGAGEVDLLAINLLAIPGDDLGEGHRESPC